MAEKKVRTHLNLNQNNIKNLATPVNQLDAVNKDFIDDLFVDLLNIGTWLYDGSTLSNPSINTFRVNNSNMTQATILYIHTTDINSFVCNFLFNKMQKNNIILIQDASNSNKWIKYKILSIIDNTTYFTFNIQPIVIVNSSYPSTGFICKIKFLEPSQELVSTFGLTVDGAGSVITPGIKGYLILPYDAIIIGWDIIGNTVGNCEIDIWRGTSYNIPTVANTIAGTQLPKLISQQINNNNNLSTWTTALNIYDVIAFNVISADTVSRINVIIKIIKL
jgi:hypothetical protein